MSKYNNGIIFTNENCMSCNKCVAICSILGANVFSCKNGASHIEVDSEKCNHCGKCIQACSHNARDYKDDISEFMKALKEGEQISVILPPSFYILYPNEYNKILAYLKSIGVNNVYDGSIGGSISVYLHIKYLKEHEHLPANQRAFISAMCPALVNVVEQIRPELLPKLIPVQSPITCAAIYIHKYLKCTDKLVYLGPCIAKKDECISPSTGGELSYSVTYNRLMQWIRDNNINLDNYDDNCQIEMEKTDFSDIIMTSGNLCEVITQYFRRGVSVKSYSGLSTQTFNRINSTIDDANNIQPLFAEVNACANGCIEGPGTEHNRVNATEIYSACEKIRQKYYRENNFEKDYNLEYEELCEKFKGIQPSDFSRTFIDRYKQQFRIPENVFDDVFSAMLKDTDEKRNINCGYCGYSSCKEMARAIALGYNRRENCIQYVNEENRRRFLYDPLTGFLNKEAFLREFAQKMVDAAPNEYFIAFGNINKLNVLNDIYSFTTGNIVIRDIAKSLESRIVGDCSCSYFGGGNYVFLIKNTPENMVNFCNHSAFDFSAHNIDFLVTMRFGLYIIDNPATPANTMLGCAYIASTTEVSLLKSTYTFYNESIGHKVNSDANITAQMVPALRNKEFAIWFQPQYSSSSGKICGAEVLCRWIKPDGSIISPGIFIPIAEKSGFIRFLDSAIWRMSFEALRRWLDNNMNPVPLSINISRVSMQTDKIITIIKNLKEEFDIPTELVHFEITESSYFANDKELIERINAIRNLGFQIAMDDFGSGYSSLNSLKDMPIDILKLDMGFIRNDTNMDRGGTIINAVSRMAHDLELITVAEGVEKPAQADFLTSIGIDVIQGYLYARPMPENEYDKILTSSEERFVVTKQNIYGKLDIGRFFDPTSYQSLMFEAFSGSALIIEYSEDSDSINVLRINKRGMETIGFSDKSVSEALTYLSAFSNAQSGLIYKATVKAAVKSENEEDCVLQLNTNSEQSLIWLKCHIWELLCKDRIHTLFTILENVTNEILFEKTIELTNSQFSSMLGNKMVGMCLIHLSADLGNMPDSIRAYVLRCNQEFTSRTGYSKEEVMSWNEKTALNMIHPDERTSFVEKFVSHFVSETIKPFSLVCRIRNNEGDYSKVMGYIAPQKQDDGTYIISTSFVNISENGINL